MCTFWDIALFYHFIGLRKFLRWNSDHFQIEFLCFLLGKWTISKTILLRGVLFQNVYFLRYRSFLSFYGTPIISWLVFNSVYWLVNPLRTWCHCRKAESGAQPQSGGYWRAETPSKIIYNFFRFIKKITIKKLRKFFKCPRHLHFPIGVLYCVFNFKVMDVICILTPPYHWSYIC